MKFNRDREYFNEYPSLIMQKLQEMHFTNLNSTITFLGPMLYFLARAIGAERILEIGHAEGYTAWYLANAIKDNAIRYKMEGNRYYGIDIVQTQKVREHLKDLPAVIQKLDSMELTSQTFPGIKFDMIFQDGNHDEEHVLYELETMYPQLKGKGKGYWIFHDCFGPAEETFRIVQKKVEQGLYDFQYVCIDTIYGMAIMRKMDGYDYDKRYWWETPRGEQKTDT